MKDKKRIWLGAVMVFVLFVTSAALFNVFSVVGSAPQGFAATSATSSIVTTAAFTPAYLFATSTSCVSRVITTGAQGIRLKFADAATSSPDLDMKALDANSGHWQAASTTAAYDASLYGCGAFTASTTAADRITVTEFKGFR